MIDNLFRPTHLPLSVSITVLFFESRKLPEFGKGSGEALPGFTRKIKGKSGPHVNPDETEVREPASTL